MKLIAIGTLIALFIGAIFALAIIQDGIAPNVQDMTERRVMSNESIDISSARLPISPEINHTVPLNISKANTGWKVSSCPITNFVLKNQTNATLTLGTHYSFNASYGIIYLISNASLNDTGNNYTWAFYEWCPDGYVPSQGGRAVAKLILIMSALGLLGFAVFYALKGMKT